MSPRLPSRRSKQPKDTDSSAAPEVPADSQEQAEQPGVQEHAKALEEAAEPQAAEAPAADAASQEDADADAEPEREPAEPRRSRGAAAKSSRAKAAADQGDADEDAAEKGEQPKRRKRAAASEQSSAQEGAEETAPAKRRSRTPARRTSAEPSAKRAPAERAPADLVVRARARYVRTSPRKARMVCGHLRGRSVHEARAILEFTPRGAAREWSKLLESAVANAEHNHELLEDDLVVREAYADVGPTIKRYRPRALGRATSIYKRTSHLTITLAPRR